MFVANRIVLVWGFILLTLLSSAVVRADQSATSPDVNISPLETRVLGQTTWLCGGPAALRVIVNDHRRGRPVRAHIDISLARLVNGAPAAPVSLLSQRTDRYGTLDAVLHPGDVPPGAYRLTLNVASGIGDDTVTQDIQFQTSQQILLTADKPVYQPGQVMHLRALALNMATRMPVKDVPIVFEVEDGRGNKVFKQRETLSRYGIAAADFQLADEVNMGNFTLRAVLPSTQQEKTVRVDRYVLPKFKVVLSTDQPYYLPGSTVHGTVTCKYFFGKPVAGAQVHIAVNTIDIGVSQLGEVQGQTGADGSYVFDYQLPDSFVGQPFEEGKGVVEFDADVKDSADHIERQNKQLPVVAQQILLALVPDRSALVPGIPNRVYVAVATPDGQPLRNAHVTVAAVAADDSRVRDVSAEETLTTDAYGLVAFTFTPRQGAYTINADVNDGNGKSAHASVDVQSITAHDGVLLRTDKTFAKVGDDLHMRALSTVRRGTIYFDVVREGQTILTKAVDANYGSADLDLPITADMAGTLQIHAYAILPDEDIVRDTRTIIVSPADDLAIRISTNQQTYHPGDTAQLSIDVTGADGRGTPAALGLAIVDESVFALSELQPGLEKIYFTLEKELMEPKYEIHGLSPAGLYEEDSSNAFPSASPLPRPLPEAGRGALNPNGDSRSTGSFLRPSSPLSLEGRGDGGEGYPSDSARQLAGAMLLSSDTLPAAFALNVDTYVERWNVVKERVVSQMQVCMADITPAVAKYKADTGEDLGGEESLQILVDKAYLKQSDLTDPWGKPYRISWGNGSWIMSLSSSGPDGKWNTADDIVSGPNYRLEFDGAFGGREERAENGPEEAPAAAMNAMDDERTIAVKALPEGLVHVTAGIISDNVGAPVATAEPRVRSYFPETLLWNPSLITDDSGHATLPVPLADSITTWRLSAMANGLDGQLGSTTASIPVFQEFFADIDLPVALTQHDRVTVPVALYNYAPTAQDVTVTLKTDDWFTLDGSATQTVHLDANQVSMVSYSITATGIGKHSLEVTAKGTKLSDAVRRDIEVLPDGREVDVAVGDRLDAGPDGEERTVTIPPDSVPGATRLWLKLDPGGFSQVVDGLDGLLRMPNGCFEQTSSTTYPDVLILSYLKANKKINPEIQMQAEQYINVGYQRLVTFECKNGGFSWFGNEPAHQVLTAYGLLEFSDMSKVHDVDPALITRTQRWLASKQRDDGSWLETNDGIAEGIINRQTGALRTTAYVAWALAESGYTGPELDRGIDYVKAHLSEADDPYTLAVILNLFTAASVRTSEADTANAVAARLVGMAKTTDKTACWSGTTQTFTGASGDGADLETTSLAAYALLKYGHNSGFVQKVLTYLVQNKDSFGSWGSTQATVWSMKALLFASTSSFGSDGGTVDITVNGNTVDTVKFTADDGDVVRQIDITGKVAVGDNQVKTVYHGDGALSFQIASRYYLPWVVSDAETSAPVKTVDVMALHIDYDKSTLAENDVATATVTLHNNIDETVEMPLVDLGVPPGFDVVTDGLDTAVANGRISKYTVAARQIIVYLEKLDPNATVTLTYQIRAKYPLKALTPASHAYPYYNPTQVTVATPQSITVTKG